MNTQRAILALVFCTACLTATQSFAVSPVGVPSFPEAGPAPDPANWATDQHAGVGALQVINHRLSYITDGTPTHLDFESLTWKHNGNLSDWSFPLNVSMLLLDTTTVLKDNQFVQYGIQAVGPGATPDTFSIYIEEFNIGGTLTRQFHAVGNGVNVVSDPSTAPVGDLTGLQLRFSSAAGSNGGLFAEVKPSAADASYLPFAHVATFTFDHMDVFGVSGSVDQDTAVPGPTISAGTNIAGVAAVPEPSAWAAMLAGLVMLGLIGAKARNTTRGAA